MEIKGGLSAAEALRMNAGWKAHVRAIRHDCWVPLLVFGLVTLGAAPMFWQSGPSCMRSCNTFREAAFSVAPNPGPIGNPLVYGFVDSGLGRWISVYWIVAVPLASIVTALYYRSRALRTGLEAAYWPAIAAGLLLLTTLVAFTSNFLAAMHLQSLVRWVPMFTLQSRGLGPLVVIGLYIGVLALLSRRWSLGAVAGLFCATATLANLNMGQERPVFGFGLTPSAEQVPNLVVPGLVLMVAGLAYMWSDRRRSNASRWISA